MEERELISIIIPVYNTAKNVLTRCVESIINQTYTNLEIIIINDGSNNDETLDTCDKLKNKDDRIKIINQKNLGVSAARNNGLKNAIGKYISFIDSDDFIDNDYISQLYNAISESNCDIAFSSYKKVYKNRITIKKIYSTSKILYNKTKHTQFNEYNLDIMGTVWGKLYKSSIIKNNEFYTDIKNGEDVLFNYNVFNDKLSYLFINNKGYNYTIDSNSTVRKFKENMLDEYKNTISIMSTNIKKSDNFKRKNSYYLWIYTFYRVLLVNYYFNKDNRTRLKQKIVEIKKFRNSKIVNESFQNANPHEFTLSRKIVFYLLKYNLIYIFLFTIKFQN